MINRKNIITAFIVIVLAFLLPFLYSMGGSFTPKWEINDKKLSTLSPPTFKGNDYMTSEITVNMNESDLGIKCGDTVYKLGTMRQIKSFKTIAEAETDTAYVKHVLSPSCQYELVCYQDKETEDATLWYIYGIRTTSPNVYTTHGAKIGATRSEIKKVTGLNLKKETYDVKGATINFNFSSGVLTEVYMHV